MDGEQKGNHVTLNNNLNRLIIFEVEETNIDLIDETLTSARMRIKRVKM